MPPDPNDPLIPMPPGSPPPPSTAGAPPPPPPTPGMGARTAMTGNSAVLGNVGELETVSGQLDKVLDKGGPLISRARAGAQEQATARGLQNSTMAAQAGELAAIQSALPIAAQDAQTYGQRAGQNLASQNQFNLQESSTLGQLRTGDQSIQGQIRVGAADTGNRMTLLSAEGRQRSTLLSQEGAQRLDEIRLQTGAQERQQSLEQNFRLLQQDRAAGIDLNLEDKRFQSQTALVLTEYAQRMGLSNLEQSQQMERLNVQHLQTLEEIRVRVDATKASEVAPRLGSQYLSDVSQRMQQSSAEISAIYQTQGLNASQQMTAVQNAYARMQSDLAAVASYYQQSPNWDRSWGQGPNASPVPAPARTPAPAPAPAPPAPDFGESLIPDFFTGIAGFN